ncbi:hypothetical protein OAO18_07110, partial [Francisellaceae bacterium]|nr:hypothetical protein [Francisellaceae bacterium]
RIASASGDTLDEYDNFSSRLKGVTQYISHSKSGGSLSSFKEYAVSHSKGVEKLLDGNTGTYKLILEKDGGTHLLSNIRMPDNSNYINNLNSIALSFQEFNKKYIAILNILNYMYQFDYFYSSSRKQASDITYKGITLYESIDNQNYRQQGLKSTIAITQSFSESITSIPIVFESKSGGNIKAEVAAVPGASIQRYYTWDILKPSIAPQDENIDQKSVFFEFSFEANSGLDVDELAYLIITNNIKKMPEKMAKEYEPLSPTMKSLIQQAFLQIDSNNLAEKFEKEMEPYEKLVPDYFLDDRKYFGDYAGLYESRHNKGEYHVVVRFRIGSNEYQSQSYWDQMVLPLIVSNFSGTLVEPKTILNYSQLLPGGDWSYYCNLNIIESSTLGNNDVISRNYNYAIDPDSQRFNLPKSQRSLRLQDLTYKFSCVDPSKDAWLPVYDPNNTADKLKNVSLTLNQCIPNIDNALEEDLEKTNLYYNLDKGELVCNYSGKVLDIKHWELPTNCWVENSGSRFFKNTLDSTQVACDYRNKKGNKLRGFAFIDLTSCKSEKIIWDESILEPRCE